MRKFVFIEKLPSGNYSVRHWQDTKFIREWFSDYGLAKRRAADLEVALLAKKQGQAYSTSSPMDLLKEYVNDPEANKGQPFSDETKSLKLNLKVFIEPLRSIGEVETQKIKAYLNMIENQTTRSIRYRDLHAFCQWCLKKGYMKENPFYYIDGNGAKQKISKPKPNKRTIKLLKPEIEKLLQHCPQPLKLRLIHFATTGKRKSEVLKTEWEHLDLENAVWFIPGKNSKSKRDSYVPLLNETFVKELKKYKTSLLNPVGKIYPQCNIGRDLRKAVKRAGIAINVTPHVFRHSFASNWDGDPAALMGLMGWTSLAMIKDYTHLNVEDLRIRAKGRGIAGSLQI